MVILLVAKNYIFDCLSCKHLIVDADDLGYFKHQLQYWEERVVIFAKHESLKENAEYNLELHRKIVERIENTINQSGGVN